MTDNTLPAGWLPHDGGPCPVPLDSPVTIRVRGGEVTHWDHARAVIWERGTFIHEICEALPDECEVVAYCPETVA